MCFGPLRRFALLGLVGLAICGCGGGSKASPPAATEAATADKILGLPVGWAETLNKSGELYRAGKYAESIAVLEAFAKAHPRFADVEIHLGDIWKGDHDALGPLPERLAKAASHYRRAFELATTDDFGRKMAADALLRVYWRQTLDSVSASLSVAEQRQLIADAGSFADDVLKKEPANEDALKIKSRLVAMEARLKK